MRFQYAMVAIVHATFHLRDMVPALDCDLLSSFQVHCLSGYCLLGTILFHMRVATPLPFLCHPTLLRPTRTEVPKLHLTNCLSVFERGGSGGSETGPGRCLDTTCLRVFCKRCARPGYVVHLSLHTLLNLMARTYTASGTSTGG